MRNRTCFEAWAFRGMELWGQWNIDIIPISPIKENIDPNMTSENGKFASHGPTKSGDEQIIAFHDPENFKVKHHLMNEWTL